jgi:hypothetical protein
MRASEFIVEAFDKPYAFNWDSSYYGNYGINVKLPDGNSLTISFYNEDKDNDVWHVAFARGYSQEVTGEGDAQRIFATVLHAIQQFIGKVHPEKLYFSASKKVEPGQNSESRAKLYSRMVKRYASSMGYDSVTDDFGRDSVMYILNKKQDVAEGKVKLYTDPNYFGAEVDDAGFDSLPVVNIPTNRLVGFEPDEKMQEPTSRTKVKKILAVLKQDDDLPPILVRKYKKGYQVLDGHHRFWAYKLSDAKSIPSRIVPDSDIEEISKQDVTEEQSTPTMGINVRSDGNIDYASLIVDGKKKYESRQTDSLRPYVGKTVAIVRTGKGPAVAIGQVTVGEPIVVDAQKFDKMRKQHLVPQGSKFDIGIDATKYLYPMINPVRWDNEKLVKQKGIVARKID